MHQIYIAGSTCKSVQLRYNDTATAEPPRVRTSTGRQRRRGVCFCNVHVVHTSHQTQPGGRVAPLTPAEACASGPCGAAQLVVAKHGEPKNSRCAHLGQLREHKRPQLLTASGKRQRHLYRVDTGKAVSKWWCAGRCPPANVWQRGLSSRLQARPAPSLNTFASPKQHSSNTQVAERHSPRPSPNAHSAAA